MGRRTLAGTETETATEMGRMAAAMATATEMATEMGRMAAGKSRPTAGPATRVLQATETATGMAMAMVMAMATVMVMVMAMATLASSRTGRRSPRRGGIQIFRTGRACGWSRST